jgi:hypothetical protein
MPEKGTAGGADLIAALGVPLYPEKELDRSGSGSSSGSIMFHVEHLIVVGLQLDGLNDAIVRTAGYDPQAVARSGHGLVMAAVDGQAQKAIGRGGLVRGEE